MVYTLLGQIAEILAGEITAVEIMPAPNGMAAGRLCIDGREGTTLLPVEIALGIGLAVVLGLPLRVSSHLVEEAPRLDQSSAPGASLDAPPLAGALPSEVPDAFRRAFSGS